MKQELLSTYSLFSSPSSPYFPPPLSLHLHPIFSFTASLHLLPITPPTPSPPPFHNLLPPSWSSQTSIHYLTPLSHHTPLVLPPTNQKPQVSRRKTNKTHISKNQTHTSKAPNPTRPTPGNIRRLFVCLFVCPNQPSQPINQPGQPISFIYLYALQCMQVDRFQPRAHPSFHQEEQHSCI